MLIYDRIRRIVKEKGKTITGLEQELGFAKGSLSKIDKNKPSLERAVLLADYLGVSVEYLMTGKEAPKEPQSSMERKTIAHDLALIKLNGSDLPTAELLAKYKEYYSEIFSMLDSPSPVRKAQVTRSPI